jgi:uncharacterized protein YqhQ
LTRWPVTEALSQNYSHEAMTAADKSKEADKKEADKPSTLEKYGKATLVTILILFAIEMIVLVPLLRFGMDISPLTSWIDSTFGSSLTAASYFVFYH